MLINLLLASPILASSIPNIKEESSAYHQNAGVLSYVNPLVGTRGTTPNNNGGMIPSVSPPFGMTRWTPQTRENYISQVPYSDLDRRLHGFQATHQPAIWMGESGQVVLTPGTGEVKPQFQHRGLRFRKEDEKSTPYVYEIVLDADSGGDFGFNLTEEWASNTMGASCPPCPGGASGVGDDIVAGSNGRTRKRDLIPGLMEREDLEMSQMLRRDEYEGTIRVAMTASGHVGRLRIDFEDNKYANTQEQAPYVSIQASRLNWTGSVEIDAKTQEVSGSNTQRQDYNLGPDKPASFRGYFVSRFSEPFTTYGTTQGSKVNKGAKKLEGKDVGGFVTFHSSVKRVEVRTGVSYVSIEQARRNLEIEAPDHKSFESTIEDTKSAWLEKLGSVTIHGSNKTDADHDPRSIFYTGLFHSLQYPNDYSEPTDTVEGGTRVFYSGYTDSVHKEKDSYYQSWSIWDTYRAEHSLLTLFAPERVDSMMRTLLRIFDWSGRLPMWANMVETNIMIATNADVVLANAISRGFKGFDIKKAWQAVKKDAYQPPDHDTKLLYYDREPNTRYEARAGLTSYMEKGWVANDGWSESASRTLDYSFNDYACAVVATHADEKSEADKLFKRANNYKNLWHKDDEFMQAKNLNGSWANNTWGWTEGDRWVYTFDVMHDPDGLASLFRHGKKGMKAKLDEHFSGGHNLHSNEPSHHVPYLYSVIGYPSSSAEQIRQIAWDNYNATAAGLSGNEDLGQMSAWYVFSALGFYPVNPAGDEYVVGSPFFDKVEIALPGAKKKGQVLTIEAAGAAEGKKYVSSLTVDGRKLDKPVLKHGDIIGARKIVFGMSDTPGTWGTK